MKRFCFVIMYIFCLVVSISAQQREITPVDVDDKKPKQPVMHYYDKHGNPLKEPVMFYSELDTILKEKKKFSDYPLLNALSLGVNVWDPIMFVAGQKYGGIDVWADLSIHNSFFPIVEFGVGVADDKPENGNYRYKGKPSFYGKIGLNYNFFRKSNSDYQLYLGVRGGFSSFKYDITDITINSPYWSQTNQLEILDQHATAIYGEAVVGIKVKIWKAFSMGWSFRYHYLFKCNDAPNSSAWYIPGFGTRNSKLGATFSLIYTIPFSNKQLPEESTNH